MNLNLKLHDKQSVAFRSPATEILFGGAKYGGKSHLLRVAAIAWCCAVPGLQAYLFRRKSTDLWKNHMDGPGGFLALLGPWIQSGAASVNTSRGIIRIGKEGSAIHLCHCKDEKDKYNYQGAEIHLFLPDELTHFTESQYRYLRSQCRLGALRVPKKYDGQLPKIIAGTNPGNVGHAWVKQSFIDPKPPLEVWRTDRPEGGMLRQFIPAKLEDNPTASEQAEDYEAKLEGLGSPELVRAMRHGDWDVVMGGMFDDVWDVGIHAVHPFKIPSSWSIDRSFDWGSSRPFSVGWWAESDGTEAVLADGTTKSFPRGTLFRIGEWYGWNGRANEGCRMISTEIGRGVGEREESLKGSLLNGHSIEPGPADSSIYDVIDGRSIADDMATTGISWLRANKGPGSRRNGWEIMRRRLKASLPSRQGEPMEEPGLFVFETCRHFIRTVPLLPRSERDPEDVDTNAEDHIGDETRYRLLAPPPPTIEFGPSYSTF